MPRKKIVKTKDEIVKETENPVEAPKEETPEEQPVLVATVNIPSGDIKHLEIERAETGGFPLATKLPNVRGGICDFCGVVDQKLPSHLQYTACKHYAGLELRCSYCPEGTDTVDITKHRLFRIFEYPLGSGKLTVVCDDMRCETAHTNRFKIRRTV